MTARAPTIQDLLDHHAIRQTLALYCRGCDRGDETLMASVYADDSWDDHGHFSGAGKPFSQATVQTLLETTKVVSHLLGQSLIWVDGETASAETYFFATMVPPSDGNPQRMHHISGRYVDQLAREGGAWLLKKRLTIRDWSATHKIDEDELAQQGLKEAGPGPLDASWTALGQRFSGEVYGRLQRTSDSVCS